MISVCPMSEMHPLFITCNNILLLGDSLRRVSFFAINMTYHFLPLTPHVSARRVTPETSLATAFQLDTSGIIATPMETDGYDDQDAERCCQACRCNCPGRCCAVPDTGQQYLLDPDYIQFHHYRRLTEALNRVNETATTSEASYGTSEVIQPESGAPEPWVAPSMRVLDYSSAYRTKEEILDAKWQALSEELLNEDPFSQFISPPEDGEPSWEDPGGFPVPETTESMLVSPPLSSHMSMLSIYSPFFPHGGNNSNCDLTGVGGGLADSSIFLRLSSTDRR